MASCTSGIPRCPVVPRGFVGKLYFHFVSSGTVVPLAGVISVGSHGGWWTCGAGDVGPGRIEVTSPGGVATFEGELQETSVSHGSCWGLVMVTSPVEGPVSVLQRIFFSNRRQAWLWALQVFSDRSGQRVIDAALIMGGKALGRQDIGGSWIGLNGHCFIWTTGNVCYSSTPSSSK